MNLGFKEVTQGLENAMITAENAVVPVRQSILKRFPIVFLLSVTFGVAATFFGIERIIADTEWLNDRPILILILGLLILSITGQVYKKLG